MPSRGRYSEHHQVVSLDYRTIKTAREVLVVDFGFSEKGSYYLHPDGTMFSWEECCTYLTRKGFMFACDDR